MAAHGAMKRVLVSWSLLILLPTTVVAEERNDKHHGSETGHLDVRSELLHYDHVSVATYSEGKKVHVLIKADDDGHPLMALEANEVSSTFSESYQELFHHPNGTFERNTGKTARQLCHFFSGTVSNVTDSFVSLSICHNGQTMYAIIHAYGETFELIQTKHDKRHVLFNHKHYRPKKPFHCPVGEHEDGLDGDDANKHNDRHQDYQDVGHGHHHHHGHEHDNHHHGHEYHHHDPRDHHHHHTEHGFEQHHSHKVHPQLEGDCANNNIKYVGLVIVNDKSRFDQLGDSAVVDSAVIFEYMKRYYIGGDYGGETGFPGVRATGLGCRIELVLLGQILFRDADSHSSAPCASGNSFDANCLLTSFNTWHSEVRSEITAVFGSNPDNFQLFSNTDFVGSTIGLAGVSSMCSTSRSSSVNQVTSGSLFFSAGVTTHEMGHNLGALHDPSGTFAVMAPAANNPPAKAFTALSITYFQTFFDSRYGGGFNSRCLEDQPTPLVSACGNGIVEPGEDCDAGAWIFDDPCCTRACTLNSGCQCDPTEACCDSQGRFLPSSTVCRPAQDSECDTQEFCTGQREDCPPDIHSLSGGTCTGTAPNGYVQSGNCYAGNCVVPSSLCNIASFPDFRIGRARGSETICQAVYCHNTGGSFITTSQGPAPTGTDCGSGMQCVRQSETCELSSSSMFRIYRWNTGVDGCQNAVCTDESGATVSSNLCAAPAPVRPPRCANGPTPTPPPSPTPSPTPAPITNFPTPLPTRFPTPFPTSPAPTPDPTPEGATYGPTATPAPTAAPASVAPTASPTEAADQWSVLITIAGYVLDQLTPELRLQWAEAIAGYLGVDPSVLRITWRAGSVVGDVLFLAATTNSTTLRAGPPRDPRRLAEELSGVDTGMLGAALNATVEAISGPIRADGDDGGSGGGGGGGDNIGLIVGAVVGALLAVGLVVGIVLGLRHWNSKREDHEKAKAHITSPDTHGQFTSVHAESKKDAAVKGSAWGTQSTPQAALVTSSTAVARPGPPPQRLPEGWTQHHDDNGAPYYFHAETGESRWDPPRFEV